MATEPKAPYIKVKYTFNVHYGLQGYPVRFMHVVIAYDISKCGVLKMNGPPSFMGVHLIHYILPITTKQICREVGEAPPYTMLNVNY